MGYGEVYRESAEEDVGPPAAAPAPVMGTAMVVVQGLVHSGTA